MLKKVNHLSFLVEYCNLILNIIIIIPIIRQFNNLLNHRLIVQNFQFHLIIILIFVIIIIKEMNLIIIEESIKIKKFIIFLPAEEYFKLNYEPISFTFIKIIDYRVMDFAISITLLLFQNHFYCGFILSLTFNKFFF